MIYFIFFALLIMLIIATEKKNHNLRVSPREVEDFYFTYSEVPDKIRHKKSFINLQGHVARNFVAIDVETATDESYSVCRIAFVVFKNGEVTKYGDLPVQPPMNVYIHENTAFSDHNADTTVNAPLFPEVWDQLLPILCNNVLVANTSSGKKSIISALDYYNLPVPKLKWDSIFRRTRMKLKEACKVYEIPMPGETDTLHEALACGMVYKNLGNSYQ